MEDKLLLTIAILTYNRAESLKKLLETVLPQVKELNDQVNVCISNNSSSDNTDEIVSDFEKKYPGFINYNKNQKNLGMDKNMLKVLEMSEGSFVWLFGDDDLMAEGALKYVVNFIKNNKTDNVGLMLARTESYFFDKKTNQKKIWGRGVDKNKPEIFLIDKKDIISLSFKDITFISGLILNNKFIKEIFREDKIFLEKGIGTQNIHIILYSLMFFKYPNIEAVCFNKIALVFQEMSSYRLVIENIFNLHYKIQKDINNLLLSSKYINSDYAHLILERNKKIKKIMVVDFPVMKAFNNYNYFSYFGCLKLFFKQAPFFDALIFSVVFSLFFLVPSFLLKTSYKILLMLRHKRNWKKQWDLIYQATVLTTSGNRPSGDDTKSF